jgi:hypothetical protein
MGSGSSPTIRNCRLIGNVTALNGGAVSVGAGLSSPVMEDCTFESNQAAGGAAIFFAATTSPALPQLTRCRFIGNFATGSAGGGAIVHNQNGFPGSFGNLRVQDCIFIANESHAGSGGAVALQVLSHSEFTQCLFSRNRAFRSGGGIWCNSTAAGLESLTTLTNCTFSDNAALFPVGSPPTQGIGGGLRIESQFAVTVRNSLFWGNTANDADLGKRQISYGLAPSVTYTSIEGYTSGLFPGAGNNGGDPKFVSAAMDTLRVTTGSAAIDAADRAAVPGVSEDLDGSGHARLLDDPNTANSGPGIPADWMDRGAYEFDRLRDCDNDGTQDNDEVSAGAPDCNDNGKPDVCEVPPICANCGDCNANGIPDSCELANGALYDCDGDGIPEGCAGEFVDCNHNCTNDAMEISPSTDCNGNGILDDCELVPRRYSGDADFEEGVLINVNHDYPGRLLRNAVEDTAPLPYIWVAASNRGTVVRIDTDTGTVLGEYRTAPSQHYVPDQNGTSFSRSNVTSSPSRTTVDLDGSVWLANRGDNIYPAFEVYKGSVVKIGLVIGGTRVNADGSANPTSGGYLAPPFKYCTCEDRNGDGFIRTSSGLGNILDWDNWNGVDSAGGVANAEDECIIRYTRVAATGTRTIALDKDNNIWTGGIGDTTNPGHFHENINGFSGASIAGTQFNINNLGGYGGLIDCQGFLWSATNVGNLLRVDTTNTTSFMSIAPWNGISYGLGLDTNGNVWMSNYSGDSVQKVAPDGTISLPNQHFSTMGASNDRGVALTPIDNNVWVANSSGSDVSRLDNDGNFVRIYSTPTALGGGAGTPTGVAVDARGKVWVTNQAANNVARINPVPPNDGVDMVVSLTYATEQAAPQPYNYGDMTGVVGLMGTGANGIKITFNCS